MTDADALRRILSNHERVAIVGLSADRSKPSNQVARYLLDRGFEVTPVNPVDIVNLFQRSERVPPFIDAAIDIGARVVWMQLDIAHEESAEKARAAGLEVIMDRCIKIEYARLFDEPDTTGVNTGAI